MRRPAEDPRILRAVTAGSDILDLGRASRFATDAQWRALVIRDAGCRYSGYRAPEA